MRKTVLMAVVAFIFGVFWLTGIEEARGTSAVLNEAESLYFYGAGTNTTFNVEFTIDILLNITADNSVTGTLNATGLPNGRTICGAGDITGTKQGNNISFSFVSFDPDPGCGFDHNLTMNFVGRLEEGGRVLAGDYTISNGQRGVFRAFSEDSWPDLSALESKYKASIGTNEEAYIKQYLCIATESCNSFTSQGSNSWANGFVRHLFEATMGSDGIPTSAKVPCFDFMSDEVCFAIQGEFHYRYELEPGFMGYCLKYQGEINYDQWDNDHNAFLENAIKPCLDSLASDGNLNATFVDTLKLGVPARVKVLRETVQAICGALDLFTLRGTESVDFPELPPTPSKAELYIPSLGENSGLTVTNEEFFLMVGDQIQIDVMGGSGINYHLNLGSDFATIDSNGLLTIKASPSPVTSTASMLYVTVEDSVNFGVGQFAILDVDSDGDLMVDSYEEMNGLNPNFANSLSSDRDGDLLPDIVEGLLKTDPLDRDTDDDGISDSFEVYTGSNPTAEVCTPFQGCIFATKAIYVPLISK